MGNRSMGEIIGTLRREKGMTQKELAERLNITDKAVSKWECEAAFPDTGTIPKLAEVLGITIEELMNAKRGCVITEDLEFNEISHYYDMMYVNPVSYKREIDQVAEIANRYAPSAKTVLDIACGTGAQSDLLAERYYVTGIDLSSDMLRIARKKVPDADFILADMVDFAIPRQFDIAVNLYGSIGFVKNYEQLVSATVCVHRHLKDGGLFILTPWSTKESFDESLVTKSHTFEHSGFCRMETVRRVSDDSVRIEMHHLVADNFDVTYHKNISNVSLFGEQQYRDAIEEAGFRLVERLSAEEFRMGAFVCVKQ